MTSLTLLLVGLLALVSVTLATVEAAFYLVKRRKLGHLTQNARADLINRYLADPPSVLMPVQLGTYTAHVGMTILLTSLFFNLLEHWAMLAALFVMMAYLLLFRLTLPYAIARRGPERTLVFLVPAFHLYAQAMGPLVSALRRRAEALPQSDDGKTLLGPEVPPPPVLETDENRLVESLARFTGTQVREVMTPRPDVVAVALSRTVADLRAVIRETRYSRIPVFGENLDDITGVVEVRDLIAFDGAGEEPVGVLARPVFLVPDTKRIASLLREMQQRGLPFAVVIDEYGGTAGVVSIEDIVEELVGEIKDEYDQETEPIHREADGAILVSGRVALDRLAEALEVDLSDEQEVETVGGLATTAFGRIPRSGERVSYRGFQIEVVDAERKRVKQVRFRRQPIEDGR
jgi:putative hemolysin